MTYETSRSAALRPAGAGFVLGTDWRLRSFDRNGRQEWEKPVPGAVWAVNVSQNGHWVVAAFGDGTIRWHRAADHTDNWPCFHIRIRSAGYFGLRQASDAAPGAEDLIGWHLNRGKDNAADFFPASRFRNQFYRPDVVSKVLASGTKAEAIRLADAESERKSRAVFVAAPPRSWRSSRSVTAPGCGRRPSPSSTTHVLPLTLRLPRCGFASMASQ